jgi:signal transduction histidine kinase
MAWLNKNERKKIDFVSEVLSEIIQELRGISSYLSPFTLYEYGLYNCICQLVIKLNKSNKLTRFIMNSNLEGIRFKTEIEINYYRIIQELIANALNHSKANNVEINLFYNKGEFKLEIKDDGVGISKRSFNKIKMQKLGIQNIEERAKSIKSNLLFKTKPGNGFEIILKTKTKPINYD